MKEIVENGSIPEMKIIYKFKKITIPIVIAEQSETINYIKAKILKIEILGVIVGYLIKYLFSIYKSYIIYINIPNQTPKVLFSFTKSVLLITNIIQVIQDMIFKKDHRILDTDNIMNIK